MSIHWHSKPLVAAALVGAACWCGAPLAGVAPWPVASAMSAAAANWFARGMEDDAAGRYEAAVQDYTEAIRLEPELAFAYNNRGTIYVTLGNRDAALRDFAEAIRLAPTHTAAYSNRANLYLHMGRDDEALEDYETILRLDPSDGSAHAQRGYLYQARQRYEEAIQDYTDAIRLQPEDRWEFYRNRGEVYQKTGAQDAARADYTAAIQLQPHRAELYALRAETEFNLRDFDACQEDAERAEALEPGLMTQFLQDLPRARVETTAAESGTGLILLRGGDIPESSDPGGVRTAEDLAQEVLALVNEERAKRGIAPLRLADDLMAGAAVRARELTQSFSHTRPNGQDFSTVLPKSNRGLGENAAAGQRTPKEVVASWMESPGHRANILDPTYIELGVGHAFQTGSIYGHYWIQIFRQR